MSDACAVYHANQEIKRIMVQTIIMSWSSTHPGRIRNKRQERRDKRQEIRDKKQETRNKRQETRDKKQGTGDKRQGTVCKVFLLKVAANR